MRQLTRIQAASAALGIIAGASLPISAGRAQIAPTPVEIRQYKGLFAAAATDDVDAMRLLFGKGANPNATDSAGRTPLHVAAHTGRHEAVRALVSGGANPRALDAQRYDVLTIAAVRGDVAMVELALRLGADPKAVTSPYEGTALIAAAHLGHDGVVERLIMAGAPLNHVNNLGWTALIEAIVLGDGGSRHAKCLGALLAAGANPNLTDKNGATPLTLAKGKGYVAMADMIEKAGGK